MKINPCDTLAIGTRVKVGSYYGIVQAVEVIQAVPTGLIAVHKIKLIEKIVRDIGQKRKIIPIKPISKQVNYAFIEVTT